MGRLPRLLASASNGTSGSLERCRALPRAFSGAKLNFQCLNWNAVVLNLRLCFFSVLPIPSSMTNTWELMFFTKAGVGNVKPS